MNLPVVVVGMAWGMECRMGSGMGAHLCRTCPGWPARSGRSWWRWRSPSFRNRRARPSRLALMQFLRLGKQTVPRGAEEITTNEAFETVNHSVHVHIYTCIRWNAHVHVHKERPVRCNEPARPRSEARRGHRYYRPAKEKRGKRDREMCACLSSSCEWMSRTTFERDMP